MNGPGPTPDYLATLLAGLNPPAPLTSGTPLPPVAPPPPASGYPALADLPPAPAGPPPPDPGVSLPTDNPGALMSQAPPNMSQGPSTPPVGVEPPTDNPGALMSQAPPNMSQGPSTPPVGVEPPTPVPQPSTVDPTQVEFRPVGGGNVPAHEVYMRGPQQNAHMLASFEPQADAAGRMNLHTQLQANHEEVMFEQQAQAAQARQDAAERVAIRRQQEMQSAMADYQDQIQQLGQMHLDQNRWWANQSTPEKIGNTVAVFMGGFFGGGNGAFQRISKQIDQDIEAQKFDYNAASDQARGAQTAFGMLMQRYGSEDAATNAARAAALDYAAAKVNQEQAQWKGLASQNETDKLIGDLGAARENAIASGFRFIPAQSAAPKYQMAFRGHVAPGLFNEQQAQTHFLEHQTKPSQKADETILGGEVDAGKGLLLERAKSQAEKPAKINEEAAKIAQMLQTSGVPLAKQAALTAKAALAKSPGGYKERAARAVLPGVAQEALLDDDANAREQAWQDFANQAMKATMGNVVAAEEVRANVALGNKSQSGRKRAIENTLRILNAEEDNAMASAPPEVQAKYREQKAAATGARKEAAKMPSSFTPHGEK